MYNTLTSEELIKQEFSKERQDSDKSSTLHVVPGIDDKLLIKSLELFKDSDFNIDPAKIIAILNSNTGFTMDIDRFKFIYKISGQINYKH